MFHHFIISCLCAVKRLWRHLAAQMIRHFAVICVIALPQSVEIRYQPPSIIKFAGVETVIGNEGIQPSK